MSRDDKSATVLFYFTSFLVSRMDDKVPPQLFLARVDQLDGLACELRMGLTNFWSSIMTVRRLPLAKQHRTTRGVGARAEASV